MKRIFCLLCVLVLVAGLLVACGQKSDAQASPSTPAGSLAEEQSSLSEVFAPPDTPPNVTWPENEYTEQLPKPDFETVLGFPGETEFSVFCIATVDQLRDYVKELRKAGFKQNESTTDEKNVYSYTASNKKGYIVEVNCSNTLSGIATLKITKLQ